MIKLKILPKFPIKVRNEDKTFTKEFFEFLLSYSGHTYPYIESQNTSKVEILDNLVLYEPILFGIVVPTSSNGLKVIPQSVDSIKVELYYGLGDKNTNSIPESLIPFLKSLEGFEIKEIKSYISHSFVRVVNVNRKLFGNFTVEKDISSLIKISQLENSDEAQRFMKSILDTLAQSIRKFYTPAIAKAIKPKLIEYQILITDFLDTY